MTSSMKFPRVDQLPPYVLAQIVERMLEARRKGSDIVNLGMGNPDLPTPDFIVDKLIEAARNPRNHRYSLSKGIRGLRQAVADWYARHYSVTIDPETEAVVTMGSKEGLAHLFLAMAQPGDAVITPDPAYPIHTAAAVIAGAEVCRVPLCGEAPFLAVWKEAIEKAGARARLAILSFPANPTTQTVDLDFFTEAVAIARHYKLPLIHDLAYADLVFDGYRAPSILQVPGAKEIAVEFYTLSKSFSMPGWRVAFCVGNREMLRALTRIKSYLDYGIFQPVQVAAAVALREGDGVVQKIAAVYRGRRDVLCDGLNRIGWSVEPPRATMFVWAKIPEPFRAEGSVAFAERLLDKGGVAVSPGIGFGPGGEGAIRFALVENESRIRQAVRGIRTALS
ncbi:MAG: aminotransferase class I/II-fold pyridoxal phosphate-dependent enzyme [Deltaproteobacteria bacterium]|nr:aminotransferase class I/II-fold pyridoxal phosphate-dependent enzyme [Deltaproteobacteria bacterium]